MKTKFVISCSCGGTSVTNYVEVHEHGYGEMKTVCTTCNSVTNATSLCQDVVAELLEEQI